jgi:uncharacterized glyoxalase superfamily protein PhnB
MTQPTFTAYPTYLDPRAAIAFLEAAFGFEIEIMVEDEAGAIVHAEMAFGDGRIGIGAEWLDRVTSPRNLGKATCFLHVHIETDVDTHCARARAAGAVIVTEPETKPYGDRTYVAADPEGNMWSFGQTVDAAERATWDPRA